MRHFIVEDFITPMYCPVCGNICQQKAEDFDRLRYHLMISCRHCDAHNIGTYFFKDAEQITHKRYVAHKSYTASNFIEIYEEKMRVKNQEED